MKLQAISWAAGLLATATFWAGFASAHCDGLDGPVVGAARAALESGDVKLALIWVRREDEGEIRSAFEHTRAVRGLGTEARDLADLYFFETLVRVHRAGEGAPYTGLKPAGRDLGPAIPAADRALESGDIQSLVRLLGEAVQAGLSERFTRARATRTFPAGDVEGGRRFVTDYVTFIHYVERLYESATGPVEGYFPEGPSTHQEP